MISKKSIFHFKKLNFEPIGNFVHTTEYLAFAKALLARLYLKLNMYVTKLQKIYITNKKLML